MADKDKIVINIDKNDLVNEKRHKKRKHHKDDKKIVVHIDKKEEDSSSSSSDCKEENITVKIDKREDCSSSSDSDNSKKCDKKRKKKCKDDWSSDDNKKCKKKYNDDCSSSDDNKKHKKRRNSLSDLGSNSSSDSEDEDCRKYHFYKKYLLRDKDLMLAGCDAFLSAYSTRLQTLQLASPIIFEFNQNNVNIDHKPNTAEIHVRRDGIYAVFLIISTDEASQYTLFINNDPQFQTTVGINSGAGQLVNKHLILMKKDDTLTVRNYVSSKGTVIIPEVIGGTFPSANVKIMIRKIAPYPNCNNKYKNWCRVKKCKDNNKCDNYSSSDHNSDSGSSSDSDCELKYKWPKCYNRWFKKLEKMLLKDCDLALEGSDSFAAVYSDVTQTVQLESPILFNQTKILNNVSFNPGSGDLQVKRSGYFTVNLLCGPQDACQFTVFVNGVPNMTTTAGINKGANQLNMVDILQLNEDDVVSVRNHTSAIGPVELAADAGGSVQGISAILLLVKIANLNVQCVYPPWWKRNCHLKKLEFFKKFLRSNHCLEPDGAIYSSMERCTRMELNLEQAIPYTVNLLLRGVHHKSGEEAQTVCHSGVYKVMVDSNTASPAQFTMFVNDNPVMGTSDGTDSGAGQASMRQLLILHKGDQLKIVNHQSFLNPVVLTENSGGEEVGSNSILILYKIASLQKHFICGNQNKKSKN